MSINVSFSSFLFIKLLIGLQWRSWPRDPLSVFQISAQKHWLLPQRLNSQMIANGLANSSNYKVCKQKKGEQLNWFCPNIKTNLPTRTSKALKTCFYTNKNTN